MTPEAIIREAREAYAPIATWCLFSGGGDSAVLAHRCRDEYDGLAFIDTGTALPGVVEFVESFAAMLGKPLRVLEHDHDAFRAMVLGTPGRPALGFPGPGQHHRAYQRLKERQIDRLLRETKAGHSRMDRVLFLTGVRRAESQRRRTREPITKHRAAVFANPLIDWSNEAMREYRAEHKLPQSDVAALTHRSGECNCGAFAAPGEREMLASLWPEWFERRIASLEREAEALGLPACKWGQRPPKKGDRLDGGNLCSSCEFRAEAAA